MTIEERVIRYFDLASMPENLPYDTGRFKRELDITDDDINNYREKRENELSLRPVEKRNIVVKQVIKPLLKKHGFSTTGTDWYRETDNSYIIIHMQNSQFNSTATGACFCFHISASPKDEIEEKLSNQWMYNQAYELKQFAFLPYCGMLSTYYAGDWYQIDGYKDYLPTDVPVEDICRQIGEDFEVYILPELSAVKSFEDFLNLRMQKLKRYEEKEIRLLKYYYTAQQNALVYKSDVYSSLAKRRKELKLSSDDIASHIGWLDICRKNSPFTKVDAKELVIKALKVG